MHKQPAVRPHASASAQRRGGAEVRRKGASGVVRGAPRGRPASKGALMAASNASTLRPYGSWPRYANSGWSAVTGAPGDVGVGVPAQLQPLSAAPDFPSPLVSTTRREEQSAAR